MNLPILPEVDLPEGDWFVKDAYVKEYATNYAKAALAAQQAERDALLGVLRTIEATKRLAREMQQEWCPAAQGMVRMARAAIAKVGGGND